MLFGGGEIAAPLAIAKGVIQQGFNAVNPAAEFAGGPVPGQMMKDAQGMYMDVISNPVGLVKVMAELPGKIEKWSEALSDSTMKLKDYNGQIALAFAEEHRREILRNIRSGKQLGGTELELQRTLDDLKDKIQPMRDKLTMVFSHGMIILMNFMQNNWQLLAILAKTNALLGPLVILLEWIWGEIPEITDKDKNTLAEGFIRGLEGMDKGAPSTRRPGDPMSRGRR